MFDVDLEYLVDDDENVSLNGTITMKINAGGDGYKSSLVISGEKYELSGWHRRTVKVLQDICFDLFNPVDMFYPYFKDMKRCPYKAGVS